MNNSRKIPPLTSIPPEGYAAAFDYDYWRWYFFSLKSEDYIWVLSDNEWLAVNRIHGFRTDEVWSYADSPNQSAFTEYIVWMIEMNILTEETSNMIGNVSWDNPTKFPQERTMMGFYPRQQPYYEGEEKFMNYGVIGELSHHSEEVYTGWEFNSPLETPRKKNNEQEIPPAPKKLRKRVDDHLYPTDDPYWDRDQLSQGIPPETPIPRNIEENIADILNYETISNTSSSE